MIDHVKCQSDPPHVVVERLEDGRTLAQDTVGTEDGALLLQVDDEVIIRVAGSVENTTRGSVYFYHISVLDLSQLYIPGILSSEVDRVNISPQHLH